MALRCVEPPARATGEMSSGHKCASPRSRVVGCHVLGLRKSGLRREPTVDRTRCTRPQGRAYKQQKPAAGSTTKKTATTPHAPHQNVMVSRKPKCTPVRNWAGAARLSITYAKRL